MKRRDPNGFYVYILFRLNGIPFYVGYGSDDRIDFHECEARRGTGNNHHKRYIIQGILASGNILPKFKFAEGLTKASAVALERHLIKIIGREANGGPLVNLTDGGEGTAGLPKASRKRAGKKLRGRKRTDEAKERMRQAHLGKPLSEKHRKSLSIALKGRVVTAENRLAFIERCCGKKSPESIAKMSAALKGRVVPRAHIERLADLARGIPRTDEVRTKIAAGIKGIKRSAETCALISKNNRARDPEVRAKMRAAKLGKKQPPEQVAKRVATIAARRLEKQLNGIIL